MSRTALNPEGQLVTCNADEKPPKKSIDYSATLQATDTYAHLEEMHRLTTLLEKEIRRKRATLLGDEALKNGCKVSKGIPKLLRCKPGLKKIKLRESAVNIPVGLNGDEPGRIIEVMSQENQRNNEITIITNNLLCLVEKIDKKKCAIYAVYRSVYAQNGGLEPYQEAFVITEISNNSDDAELKAIVRPHQVELNVNGSILPFGINLDKNEAGRVKAMYVSPLGSDKKVKLNVYAQGPDRSGVSQHPLRGWACSTEILLPYLSKIQTKV